MSTADICGPTDIYSDLFTSYHIPPDCSIHAHLPEKLYYYIADLDPWRDSSLLFSSIVTKGKAELLDLNSLNDGVVNAEGRTSVKIDFDSGVPHCWWSVYPQLSITLRWIEDLVSGVGWTLGTNSAGLQGSTGRKTCLDSKL